MDVFLRHENSENAVGFDSVPFHRVPALVEAIRDKGVWLDADGGVYRNCDYQFCLDSENAYAEIILTGEPG